MADDIRGQAYAGGLSSLGSYGAGRYWVAWRRGSEAQVQRFQTRAEADAWAERWRQSAGGGVVEQGDDGDDDE